MFRAPSRFPYPRREVAPCPATRFLFCFLACVPRVDDFRFNCQPVPVILYVDTCRQVTHCFLGVIVFSRCGRSFLGYHNPSPPPPMETLGRVPEPWLQRQPAGAIGLGLQLPALQDEDVRAPF